jgi:hypothetical protein
MALSLHRQKLLPRNLSGPITVWTLLCIGQTSYSRKAEWTHQESKSARDGQKREQSQQWRNNPATAQMESLASIRSPDNSPSRIAELDGQSTQTIANPPHERAESGLAQTRHRDVRRLKQHIPQSRDTFRIDTNKILAFIVHILKVCVNTPILIHNPNSEE